MKHRALIAVLIVLLIVLLAIWTRTTSALPSEWSRYVGNPILSAGAIDWEITNNSEPSIIYEDGLWKMWYTGGGSHCSMGYATSSDGLAWTKYADNPILGHGRGDVDNACHSSVFKYQETYYAYFSSDGGTVNTEIYRAVSPDGIHWKADEVPSIPVGEQDRWNANSFVWVEDGIWHLLYDTRRDASEPWQMWAAISADGITWTKSNGPLIDLQINGGTYGAPFVRKEGAIYHLWYCASVGKNSTLPTDIYEATSTDLQHWTRKTDPVLIRNGGYESDQVCDPFIITVNGETRLYYSMGDNRFFTQLWIGTAKKIGG